MAELEQKILRALEGNMGLSGAMIAAKLGLPLARVNTTLRRMASAGYIVETNVVAKVDRRGAVQYEARDENKKMPGGSIVWMHPDMVD